MGGQGLPQAVARAFRRRDQPPVTIRAPTPRTARVKLEGSGTVMAVMAAVADVQTTGHHKITIYFIRLGD